MNLFLNFVYILLWSLIGVFIEFDKRYKYIMPDHWWRIVLWVGNNSNLFFNFLIFSNINKHCILYDTEISAFTDYLKVNI